MCKTISPILYAARVVGVAPYSIVHENNRCVFVKSNFWLVWSFIVFTMYTCQIIFATEILNIVNIGNGKSIHELLSSINDIIYSTYVLILTITNCLQYKKFIKTFNHVFPILKEGIFCQSSRRTLLRINYGYLFSIVTVILVQYGTITWLHFSSTYTTSFDYKILLNRFIQNVPFIFYGIFFTTCTLFIAFFVCFEKLTINILKFTPVHPMKGIDETNNKQDFLGLIKYNMCKGTHQLSEQLLKLKSPELIEYLRILHEDISILIYEMNGCLNPQLLIHTIVELTVLIVHWYAVIIYFVFAINNSLANTVHLLNCLFVFLHTFGLFLFLRTAQKLWNIVSNFNTSFILIHKTAAHTSISSFAL